MDAAVVPVINFEYHSRYQVPPHLTIHIPSAEGRIPRTLHLFEDDAQRHTKQLQQFGINTGNYDYPTEGSALAIFVQDNDPEKQVLTPEDVSIVGEALRILRSASEPETMHDKGADYQIDEADVRYFTQWQRDNRDCPEMWAALLSNSIKHQVETQHDRLLAVVEREGTVRFSSRSSSHDHPETT